MIAAVVLLALVASTQAFPGNDFVEVQAVSKGKADFPCIFNYVHKFADLLENTETGSALIDINESCKGTKDVVSRLYCISEGARAAWNFPSFRNDVMTIYPQVIEYTMGIVHECFSH